MRPLDLWKLVCKLWNIYQLVAGAKAPATYPERSEESSQIHRDIFLRSS